MGGHGNAHRVAFVVLAGTRLQKRYLNIETSGQTYKKKMNKKLARINSTRSTTSMSLYNSINTPSNSIKHSKLLQVPPSSTTSTTNMYTNTDFTYPMVLDQTIPVLLGEGTNVGNESTGQQDISGQKLFHFFDFRNRVRPPHFLTAEY